METLKVLQEVQEQRKVEHRESEQNKDKRAEERNKILREFLDILKNN